MRKTIIILLGALAITSCQNDNNEPSFLISDHTYFPLQTGNSWEYEPLAGSFPYPDFSRSEIAAKVLLGNFEYALMIRTTTTPSGTYIDSAYYRVDANGYVFTRKNDKEEEFNLYRLNAFDGDSWNSYSHHYSAMEEISVKILGNHERNRTAISQCKKYDYDVKNIFDEEGYSTLGPGLGIIQSGNYFGGIHKVLKKAIIDGQEYNF